MRAHSFILVGVLGESQENPQMMLGGWRGGWGPVGIVGERWGILA